MKRRTIKVAALLSGGGTSLQNIIDRSEAGELDAEVSVVISSREDAHGLKRAKKHDIPAIAVPSWEYKGFGAHSKAVFAELEKHPFDLIVMAGYMCLLVISEEYRGKVMNIHPALIPAFSGKGMYGRIVHESVIHYGSKVSGCTVHFADNQYDHGPIIIQRVCPVNDDDTPETLAQRVQELERQAYPEAIQLFAEGRLKIEGRRVRILPPAEEEYPQ